MLVTVRRSKTNVWNRATASVPLSAQMVGLRARCCPRPVPCRSGSSCARRCPPPATPSQEPLQGVVGPAAARPTHDGRTPPSVSASAYSPSLLASVAVQAATPPAGTRLHQNGVAGSRRETPRVTGDPGPFPPRPRQRQTAGHTAGCAPNGSGHVSVRDPARTTEGFADLHRHALPSSMRPFIPRGGAAQRPQGR